MRCDRDKPKSTGWNLGRGALLQQFGLVYAAIEDALDGLDPKRHPQLAALHTNHLSKLRRAAAFREDVRAVPSRPSPVAFIRTIHAHQAIETTHPGPWIAVSASCESSTLPPGALGSAAGA